MIYKMFTDTYYTGFSTLPVSLFTMRTEQRRSFVLRHAAHAYVTHMLTHILTCMLKHICVLLARG